MFKKDYSKTKVCKVTFTLPTEAAQGGKEVRILGEFNNWSWENGAQMKAGKNEFTAAVELAAGRSYEFRYLIDNHIWENDWAADNYVANPFGVYNSVVAVAAQAAAAVVAAPAKAAPAPKVATKATSKAKASSDVAAPAAQPAVAKTAKPAVAKTAAKPAAKKMVADDLTKIEGIGPKIAELLNAAKIMTFENLGNATVKTLQGILDAAGKRYQMHDPSTWAKQAQMAAKGEWAKLSKLQDELKGGKAVK